MGSRQLDTVRRSRQFRSLRIVSSLRLGVVAGMFAAVQLGVTIHWRAQLVLLSAYLAIALLAMVMAFCVLKQSTNVLRAQFGLVIVDVAVMFAYEQLSPPGAYVPLMVMMLLPLIVVFDISRRRAATVLIISAAAFAEEVFGDPLFVRNLGWGRPALTVGFYTLLCVTAYLAVNVQTQHVDEIAALSASREDLLEEAMAAADRQQRTISEYIHDGPLQSVLAARQEIASYRKVAPDPRLDRAVGSLHDASRQLREATFELHPAVLEHVGLAAALKELASVTGARAGIGVATDLEYSRNDPVDPLVFGVARELMSNIVHHSQAKCASVKLQLIDEACCLEVEDDGVGFTEYEAASRLAGGHIGLASHRARVEAAGGTFTVQPLSPGTRISVTVPLRGANDHHDSWGLGGQERRF
jgi:two-component system, NarL family, sensor kinase